MFYFKLVDLLLRIFGLLVEFIFKISAEYKLVLKISEESEFSTQAKHTFHQLLNSNSSVINSIK